MRNEYYLLDNFIKLLPNKIILYGSNSNKLTNKINGTFLKSKSFKNKAPIYIKVNNPDICLYKILHLTRISWVIGKKFWCDNNYKLNAYAFTDNNNCDWYENTEENFGLNFKKSNLTVTQV